MRATLALLAAAAPALPPHRTAYQLTPEDIMNGVVTASSDPSSPIAVQPSDPGCPTAADVMGTNASDRWAVWDSFPEPSHCQLDASECGTNAPCTVVPSPGRVTSSGGGGDADGGGEGDADGGGEGDADGGGEGDAVGVETGVVFSMPLYTCLACGADLLSNTFRYNPGSAVVIHMNEHFEINGTSDPRATKADLDEFRSLVRTEFPMAKFNNERYPVESFGPMILRAHVSNFRCAQLAYRFTHFAFLSANLLFAKPGYALAIVRYDGRPAKPPFGLGGRDPSDFEPSADNFEPSARADGALAALMAAHGVGELRKQITDASFYTREAFAAFDALAGAALFGDDAGGLASGNKYPAEE